MVLPIDEQSVCEYGGIESKQFNATFQLYKNKFYGVYKNTNCGEPLFSTIFLEEPQSFIYNLMLKQLDQNIIDFPNYNDFDHIVELKTEPHVLHIILESNRSVDVFLTYEMGYWGIVAQFLDDMCYKIIVTSRFGVDSSMMDNKWDYVNWKKWRDSYVNKTDFGV